MSKSNPNYKEPKGSLFDKPRYNILGHEDVCHSDLNCTSVDRTNGDMLSAVIGDTFFGGSMTTSEQWKIICKVLRLHGLKIVREDQC